MLNPYGIFQSGHLMGFVMDAERDVVVLVCRFCGVHSDPVVAGERLPDGYTGLLHRPACFAHTLADVKPKAA
jgi:hypothetical protein